jgi:hypothetical protein
MNEMMRGCPTLLQDRCESWQAQIPDYVDAALRGAAAIRPFAALRAHLATCPGCAEASAELLAALRWREAERPFNRGVLSVVPQLARGVSGQGGLH